MSQYLGGFSFKDWLGFDPISSTGEENFEDDFSHNSQHSSTMSLQITDKRKPELSSFQWILSAIFPGDWLGFAERLCIFARSTTKNA